MKSIVAVTRSRGHYEGVHNALTLIEDQIRQNIKGKKRILVKPNFVSTRRQLAATHVDAVKAVLDMVTKYHSGRIIVGEGPSVSSLKDGLVNFSYLKLQQEYDLEFLDLNQDDFVSVDGVDSKMRSMKFRLSKMMVESDYRISVALPKTHDMVIATLSIKNIIVGSLVDSDKSKVHQGYKGINLNLAKLSCFVMPHLGVIDGFVGMEGRGPVSGDPVNLRVAAASIHPVSLDAIVSRIMGFDPMKIGYLYHLNEWKEGTVDMNEIEVVGESVENFKRNFKPHPRYKEMLKWRLGNYADE